MFNGGWIIHPRRGYLLYILLDYQLLTPNVSAAHLQLKNILLNQFTYYRLIPSL
ncbi:hypothetical protein EVA_10382 [gut metagenome]|uniref:Uncharacterized protein n=1 Tax=gut metagenome TaxID=749906 RepID=J9G2R5_9ZZZZ